MFDPTVETDLVRPDVTADDAVLLALDAFGITGTVTELGSNQDRNYLLTPSDDTDGRFLLKFDNDVFPDDDLDAQNSVLVRLAERGLAVPTPVAALAGGRIGRAETPGGRVLRARLLMFVEGDSLVDDGHLATGVLTALGSLAGRTVAELAAIDDPRLDRDLQWDMRNALAVVEAYAPEVDDPERRARVLRAARDAWAAVSDVAERLPVQVIHGDLTDDNVVGTRDALGRVVPTSIIDFGDLSTGWRVAEIAVTVSSLLHHQVDRTFDVFETVRAFAERVALDDTEIAALWPLVVLRGAVLVVSGAHQVALEAGNDYARERMEHEWRIFEAADALDTGVADAAIRAATGRAATPTPEPGHVMLPALGTAGATPVRLDTASPHLHRAAWQDPDIEDSLLADVTATGAFGVLAYGEHRLTRTLPPGLALPRTASLATEIAVPATGTDVVAPFDAELAVDALGTLALHGSFGRIELQGATADEPGPVAAGTTIGHADGGARLVLRWLRPGTIEAPAFVTAPELPAWQRLTADPAPLLGLSPADWLPDAVTERHRHESAMAGAAERYYEVAPQIERGWRELLFDGTGRAYLDLVNNVAGIGHGHPRMADAVHEQLLTLNTNSRFLYRALADYVERLVALAPDPSLDAVLLVNSGSEAVDLALHLARVHTGRNDVVTLREAYHGWTIASDAVSTSAYDNPHAAATRPEWVHVADAVNPYRGRHRGPDSGAAYAADVERLLTALDEAGRPVGAFLCEPVFGNGGGIVLPDGYLSAVYESVRRRGGVCIADEVQVGLGRLGHVMWGVEQQGVVPDILVVAKALGNAYPLGAVLTTREIAASLEHEGMFFSSAGGATASAVAGLAVLDVMRDEGLQHNAAVVGDHLAARFAELATRHPIVGAVHGTGLYQGVEFVRDRVTLEPAVEETEWVCERLLDHGVIMQSTSERRNVLKVKPPLTLTAAHADLFVDALDAVLNELESRTA
ncbi:aminotransferase [Pseudoclavibacter chungangensis]|uniref:Aminotransferase n=1 Tax=Pseudoclavibacter chungangensis TaxID=587635 RepID=A0A7J5BWS5_9MICO|nr:aminotransferase [Pseudoclavibacter chungangensis]KAB1657950.1 aminotransferase [Pseudoclavibacter chungangensis]NYJ65896.1 4-aminobutyrate aminotransferase-like enzyme/Ser/Thr protein kinase RdoA (MazF antagonist) [Pseudoclavibacter chungangensis]